MTSAVRMVAGILGVAGGSEPAEAAQKTMHLKESIRREVSIQEVREPRKERKFGACNPTVTELANRRLRASMAGERMAGERMREAELEGKGTELGYVNAVGGGERRGERGQEEMARKRVLGDAGGESPREGEGGGWMGGRGLWET